MLKGKTILSIICIHENVARKFYSYMQLMVFVFLRVVSVQLAMLSTERVVLVT